MGGSHRLGLWATANVCDRRPAAKREASALNTDADVKQKNPVSELHMINAAYVSPNCDWFPFDWTH